MHQQNRQTAYKIWIADLLRSPFVKAEGWDANHVIVNGAKIARVNLMCVVVSREFNENYRSIVVDDGSGKISVRSFDEKVNLDNFQVGDAILLIARLREFGSERYLTPEIIKKINNKKWMELRKLEIKPADSAVEEKKQSEEDVKETNVDKALAIIRKLDKGDGASYEEVIIKVKDEPLVLELLKQGEIYEPKPGKLKVLE